MEGTNVTRFGREGGLGGSSAYALASDASGALWVGTSDGIARYGNGTFYRLTRADGLAIEPGAEHFRRCGRLGLVWARRPS